MPITNILAVTESFLCGGLETQIAGQCRHLRGHDVTLHLATWSQKNEAQSVFNGNVLHLSSDISSGRVDDIISSVESIVDYSRRNRIDCIHAHPFSSMLPAVMASGVLGIPVVLTLHGPASFNLWHGDLYRWLFVRAILRCCNAIFCVSEASSNVAAELVDFKRVHVLCNGVDFNEIKPAVRNPDLRSHWAVVSRLDNEKGKGVREFLIRAIQAGVERITIFGDGSFRSSLESEMAEFGFKDCITFLGQVEAPWEHLKSGFSGVAGMGRALMEGVALNLPVCLVGYEGIHGLMDSNALTRALFDNASGRGVSKVDACVFSEQLDLAEKSPERFLLRESFRTTLDEKEIWRDYIEKINSLPDVHSFPFACFSWFKSLPSGTNIHKDNSLLLKLEALFCRNGLPADSSDVLNLYLFANNAYINAKNQAFQEVSSRLEAREVAFREVSSRLEAREVAFREVSSRLEAREVAFQEVSSRLEAREVAFQEVSSRLEAREVAFQEVSSRLQLSNELNARYHRMSKDILISTYRKIRRTLGNWPY